MKYLTTAHFSYCKLLFANKIYDLKRDVEMVFIIVYYFLNQPKTLLYILVVVLVCMLSYSLIYMIPRDIDLLVTGYAGMTSI